MEKYIPVLEQSVLFAGLSGAEITSLLSCLGARCRSFRKGEYVLHQGDHLGELAILAEGELHIQRDDHWGNRSILGRLAPGDLFGEAYAMEREGVLNDVMAVEDSVVILLDARRVITACPSACPFHAGVVRNLFSAISEKNRQLVRKLEHLSMRSTREKLMSYLSEEAARQGSDSFTIPFNRQQLADFLALNRSALSNELCRMRQEGLLEFERSHFRLL